jgi:hypothetical protein
MDGLKWTNEVEDILEKLRINCVNLSDYHRKRYYYYKGYGKYFRIPQIILASLTSTTSIGLQPIMDQSIISGITCVLGMAMGILSAIEIYLNIQSNMELELKQSKEFYALAIDIYKILNVRVENRGENGKDYLNKKYSQYAKMMEASNLLNRRLTVDLLADIPEKFKDETPQQTPHGSHIDFNNEIQLQEPINFNPQGTDNLDAFFSLSNTQNETQNISAEI